MRATADLPQPIPPVRPTTRLTGAHGSECSLDWQCALGTLPPVRDSTTVGRRLGAVLALGLGLLCLAAPGPASADDYVGAEVCGTCHEAEYAQWKSTPHARALSDLTRPQQQDRVCRSCHTMQPLDDDPIYGGVQCESCHGPGRLYAPRNVMKDEELSKLLGLEAVTEKTCRACHESDGPQVLPFVYAEKLELVVHRPKAPAKAEPGAPKGGAPARPAGSGAP
jgi:hypothetical protein